MYTELIGDKVLCPTEREGCKHVYHQYTIRSEARDKIKQLKGEMKQTKDRDEKRKLKQKLSDLKKKQTEKEKHTKQTIKNTDKNKTSQEGETDDVEMEPQFLELKVEKVHPEQDTMFDGTIQIWFDSPICSLQGKNL